MYSQGESGRRSYRSSYKIIEEIGLLASDGGTTISPMIAALSLSFDEATNYIKFLLKKNVLVGKTEKNRTFLYHTQKFVDFLYFHSVIVDLCQPKPLTKEHESLIDSIIVQPSVSSIIQNGNGQNGNGHRYNNKNGGVMKRDSLHIYADIIKSRMHGKKGYMLMRDANLSGIQSKKYFKKMTEIGFLKGDTKEVTPKGYIFLDVYRLMIDLLNSDEPDSSESLYKLKYPSQPELLGVQQQNGSINRINGKKWYSSFI